MLGGNVLLCACEQQSLNMASICSPLSCPQRSDLLVTMLDEADQSHLPSGRTTASFKNLRTVLDFQTLAGSRSRLPAVILQPPSLFPSCSVPFCPPPPPSPAHAYMHTNMCPCLQLSPWPKFLPRLHIFSSFSINYLIRLFLPVLPEHVCR